MNIIERERDDLAGEQRRLAVLIDADNASPAVIEGLLAEAARFGIASVRRLYGDWTSPRHAGWKKVLLEHSLSPVQQFAYTSGKNATDSAMIIDAMDLLYTGRFDGFCLVSSDSDFTRLAQRLREEGLLVLGFGERKTPGPFVAACDKFIYTELLVGQGANLTAAATIEPASSPATPSPPTAKRATNKSQDNKTASGKEPIRPAVPFALIARAITEADDENGWAHLGAVGSYLTKIRPDFDSRLYGYKKLSDLFRAYPKRYELRAIGEAGGANKPIHVRLMTPANKAAGKTAA